MSRAHTYRGGNMKGPAVGGAYDGRVIHAPGPTARVAIDANDKDNAPVRTAGPEAYRADSITIETYVWNDIKAEGESVGFWRHEDMTLAEALYQLTLHYKKAAA